MVARASGTVLYLVNGKWQELTLSTTLSGEQVVRTMAGAGLKLTLDGVTLELGGGTALQISEGSIAQFSGRLTAAVVSGPGLRISTGVLSAVLQGTATVVFNGDTVRYSVRSGAVTIADSVHGTVVKLDGGEQVVASSASGIAPGASSAGGKSAETASTANKVGGNASANSSAAANADGTSNANANANGAAGAGNSNAGGNGNGNAGGSDNGNGSNGNAGGNGNSGDNGNAGGNGDGGGNAGGNGNGGENGNAGGNGNGNAGGNGNGNGN